MKVAEEPCAPIVVGDISDAVAWVDDISLVDDVTLEYSAALLDDVTLRLSDVAESVSDKDLGARSAGDAGRLPESNLDVTGLEAGPRLTLVFTYSDGYW